MCKKSLTQRLKILRRMATKAEKDEVKAKILIELLALLMEWEERNNQSKDG